VAQAAQGLIPIYVDCTKQGDHQDLLQRFSVHGYPTMIFLDPEGNVLTQASRDAGQLRTQIESTVHDHSVVTIPEGTIDDGLTQARTDGKLLAVLFMDAAGQDNAAVMDQVLGHDFEAMRTRFTWVKRPATGDHNRPTDEAHGLHVSHGPAIVVLDPWAEGNQRTLKAITSFRSLQHDMQKALDDAQHRGHPPANGGTPPPGDPAPTPPGGNAPPPGGGGH